MSNEAVDSLSWVKPYYTRAGEYWGPTGIEPRLEQRLKILEAHCGSETLTLLELGAGTGEVSALMADAGHDVTAVEFSPTRAPHIRELAKQPRLGSLYAVEADFYEVSLRGPFDVVCYWDGFGIGTDSDQRRLLSRIAREWLKTDGCALIDVFSPYRWVLETGTEWRLERNHPSHRYRQRRRFEFDPVTETFVDEWCPIDDSTDECDESMAIRQQIRCYSPADLQLLVEGTGLKIVSMDIEGESIDMQSRESRSTSALWKAWSYLAKLVRE